MVWATLGSEIHPSHLTLDQTFSSQLISSCFVSSSCRTHYLCLTFPLVVNFHFVQISQAFFSLSLLWLYTIRTFFLSIMETLIFIVSPDLPIALLTPPKLPAPSPHHTADTGPVLLPAPFTFWINGWHPRRFSVMNGWLDTFIDWWTKPRTSWELLLTPAEFTSQICELQWMCIVCLHAYVLLVA